MIKKLTQSSLDKKYLSLKEYSAVTASIDFNNLVVNKPWGYEYLMFKNRDIEIWNLFIGHNKTTSMHCHPNKKTALVVLDGNALFSSLNESMELSHLDTIIIDPGVFHSTQGLSKSGVRILEFENPPMKYDLVRLEDKYGRANEGYESKDKTVPADSQQIRFSGNEKNIIKNFCNNNMCIKTISEKGDLNSLPHNNNQSLVAILSGNILSRNGDVLYSNADIIRLDELKENNGNDAYVFNNVTALFINRL